MYKVSLILTTYNSREFLEKTLESIECQDYEDIEVVIKDGGSSDGTQDIIKDYASKSRFAVRYKSCPDTGIYDAMNRGYEMSSGDIVAFFNDVFLRKDAVSLLVEAIGDNVGAHADLVYSNGERTVRYWHMGPQKSIRLGWLPGHPTMFLKREVYEKFGLYDTSYRISADYEFMVRYLKSGENRLSYVPATLVSMFYGGTSNSTFGSYMDSLREGHRALTTNGIHPAFITDVLRTLRVLLQFIKKN